MFPRAVPVLVQLLLRVCEGAVLPPGAAHAAQQVAAHRRLVLGVVLRLVGLPTPAVGLNELDLGAMGLELVVDSIVIIMYVLHTHLGVFLPL